MKNALSLLLAVCVAVCAMLTPAPTAVSAEAAEWKEAEVGRTAVDAGREADEKPGASDDSAASTGEAGAGEADVSESAGVGEPTASAPTPAPVPIPSPDATPDGQPSISDDSTASADEPGEDEAGVGEPAGVDESAASTPTPTSFPTPSPDATPGGQPSTSDDSAASVGEAGAGESAASTPTPTSFPTPSPDATPDGQPSISDDSTANTGEPDVGETDTGEAGTGEPSTGEPAPSAPIPTPAPTPSPDAALTITPPQEYQPDTWRNTAPTFALSSSLTDLAGLTCAVSVDGGTPVPLTGNTYTPTREGAYALTFSLLDAAGEVIAQSAEYPVRLDLTPPAVQLSVNGLALTVTASDAGSGPAGVSLDGGQSWQPLQADEDGAGRFLYTAGEAQTLDAGMVVVRDAAGNTTANREPVTLAQQQERPEGGFPGGGFSGGGNRRGGGGATRTVSHAASDTTEVVAYNGVTLAVQDSAMTCLTLGGETLELSVRRVDESSGGAVPFTAELGMWNGELESAGDADTLILTVSGEGSGAGQYEWLFNGAVSRKLAASGIDYLVLRVGEHVTALSTAGFTAGRAYDLLRSAGVASKAFEYSLRMAEDVRQPLALTVTVEDDSFLVTENPEDDLYYYDLYTGPEALLDTAFGAYTPMG